MSTILQDRIRGSLIGGAAGDALGYPVEFIDDFKDIQHHYGEHGITRLAVDTFAEKALISDDTQMTLFTANGILNAKRHGMPGTVGIQNAYIEWYLAQTGKKSMRYRDCWIASIPEMSAGRAPGITCMSALKSLTAMKTPENNSKGCGGVMRIAPIPLYAANGRISIEDADRLAGDAAKITHKNPLGFIPAALMAHVIYRLATDETPTRERMESYICEGTKMMGELYAQYDTDVNLMRELAWNAIELSHNDSSDLGNIGHLGEGWTGEEALAIALYCALRHFDSFEEALIAAVNHGGDSDSTGAVTGNILGAAVGYEAIPQFFKDDLELHDVILHMADDLCRGEITKYDKSKKMEQLNSVSDTLQINQPNGFQDNDCQKVKTNVNVIQDRIRGSLIGGAAGDALGYPVEFIYSFGKIQSRYGERGITRLDTCQHWLPEDRQTGKAVISDDTQMTLFTANGILNAKKQGIAMKYGICLAYIEWYLTQTGKKSGKYRDCWIANVPELNERRAPGNTCMTALDAIYRGQEPVNNSKGCGGVMRIAPIPLYAAVNGRMDIEDADRLAADAAEITHQHPLGFIPAALMAHVIYRLATDETPTRESMKRYIMEGVEAIRRLYGTYHNDVERMAELAERAVLLADSNMSDLGNIGHLGEGWIGEEALAIALYCALKHFDSFEEALIAAVNHGGDSDSTGAVTGNILGAAIGYEAIPQFFKDDLELHDVILHMADDLCRGEITKKLR